MKLKPKPIMLLVIAMILFIALFVLVLLEIPSFVFNLPGKRYLIYTCRTYFCGGIADQIRGMLSVYILANKTNRVFRIEETSTCGPFLFFRPNKHIWKISKSELTSSNFFSIMADDFKVVKKGEKRKNDFMHPVIESVESVVYLQTNMPPDLKNYSTDFKVLFDKVYIMRDDMEKELTTFEQKFVGRNKSVCAQIRTGKHPGFHDVYYNNLGNISAIWDFLSHYDKKRHVFYIASDSKEVKMSAKRRFPKRLIDSPGDPFFTPKSIDDASCSVHKKVFFDLIFLSRCDVLLLTNSGLGHIASLLRNRAEEQFCFQNDITGVYPCPLYNLRWMRTVSEDENMHLRGI